MIAKTLDYCLLLPGVHHAMKECPPFLLCKMVPSSAVRVNEHIDHFVLLRNALGRTLTVN